MNIESSYRPTFIACKLIEIKSNITKGTDFILDEIDKTNKREIITITVDESIERVRNRFEEHLSGEDQRDGIYLSRGMININIHLHCNEFDINQEDLKWYVFDKNDVEKAFNFNKR